ncbi:hypothetical protein Cantr_04572 [Candida viswanathii]|uniref:Uncharacterized protein n=1 Tax=Candida viswanathii TaxID=5486 RepID=A0A367XL58_9ASCO|nr:hypothetical protein Cantr_04572 [Candida viswanathii]
MLFGNYNLTNETCTDCVSADVIDGIIMFVILCYGGVIVVVVFLVVTLMVNAYASQVRNARNRDPGPRNGPNEAANDASDWEDVVSKTSSGIDLDTVGARTTTP